MHGLFKFVDDMIHASTSDDLRDKFISEYQEDFDITRMYCLRSLEWRSSTRSGI